MSQSPRSFTLSLEPRWLDRDPVQVRAAAATACELYRRCHREGDELPEAYRAGGEWLDYVEERRHIYDAMLRDDVDVVVEHLSSFWRNELGPITSQYAYFSHLAAREPGRTDRFVDRMTADFEAWKSLIGEPTEVLAVPDVGDPWGLTTEGVLITPLALRFDVHARRIASLLHEQDRPVVLEIGGGYGGMAHRLATRMSSVSWVDVDLPETLAIAAFNVSLVLPEARIGLWDEDMTLDRTTFERHDIVLVPHHALPTVGDDSADLVLNAFSLSEMPRRTVDEYFAHIQRVTRTWFLQNNVDRRGVVNRGHERIPCSEFPIDPDVMQTVSWTFDTFQGPTGDYRESLHRRR